MMITLVTNKGKEVSIGVGKYCFTIEDGRLVIDKSAEAGAKFVGKIIQFQEAYSVACWAFSHSMYDNIEAH